MAHYHVFTDCLTKLLSSNCLSISAIVVPEREPAHSDFLEFNDVANLQIAISLAKVAH